MKKTTFIFALVFGLLSFVASGCDHSSEKTKSKKTEKKNSYQCPMDCESGKTYEQPGKCPVCEMDLEQKVEI